MSTKIAVTYEDGQVFQHFGRTQQVKIYEIDDGRIVSTQIVDTSEHGHGAMAGYVKGFGATVIICGGLGDGARNSVKEAGLVLVNGVSGDADAAVQAYIDGTLVRSGGDCGNRCHHRVSSAGEQPIQLLDFGCFRYRKKIIQRTGEVLQTFFLDPTIWRWPTIAVLQCPSEIPLHDSDAIYHIGDIVLIEWWNLSHHRHQLAYYCQCRIPDVHAILLLAVSLLPTINID